MNANQDRQKALDFILEQLNSAISNPRSTKPEEVLISYEGYDPEDLNPCFEASDLLKFQQIIEKYKRHSEGKMLIPDERNEYYGGGQMGCFVKLNFTLKPRTLNKYLVETSRIPKYTLRFDGQRRLILNDKYILSSPHTNSVNYYFIRHAVSSNAGIIKKDDLIKFSGRTNKRFHTVLEQLIKNAELRKAFFPNVTKDYAEFKNNVRMCDLDINIKINKIDKFIKSLKTI
jgi:hypothetical protein